MTATGTQSAVAVRIFHLIDTHNDRRLSSHRTLAAAVDADRKYQRAVKRANGQSSYIPTQYREGGSVKTWRTNSKPVDDDAVMCAYAD